LPPLVALDQAQTAAVVVVARLDEADWSRPTPCDEWSVRDVVNKMVASTITFTAFGRRQRPDPPLDLVHPPELLGDDPVGTVLSAAAACRAAWRSPGALDGTAPSTIGEFPAVAVLNARIFDTTILTWDVSRATGIDHDVSDPLAAYVLRVARALVPTVRRSSPDRYRDAVDVSDDRSLVEQMVAATGRDPWWKPPQ
jgi:uncharacterized protein (TIGR03086 family)